jgi:hypothetical protein
MRDLTASTPLDAPAAGPTDGATVVIEAPTAEEALADLHAQLGGDARIVEVRRVARGGIGGFFAREMVELHAAPGPSAGAAPSGPTPGATAPAPAPAPPRPTAAVPPPTPSPAPSPAPAPAPAPAVSASPASRLLLGEAARASDLDTVDFATYLRGQLAAGEVAPVARTAPEPSTHEALLERATAAAREAVRDAAAGERDGGGIVDPVRDAVAVAPADAVVAAPAAPVAPTAVADPITVVTTPVATLEGRADTVADAAPAEAAPAEAAPVELAATDVAPTDGAAPAAHAATTPAMPDEFREPPPSTDAGPAWSVAALVKLGMPAALVRSLEVADPADDVAWTAALAAALRPVCRPLPSGRSLLVGPRARAVASGIGVPTTPVGQPLRSRATTVAAGISSGAASLRWLDKVRGTRWIHVVIGGKGWRDLLHLDPLAVSWADTRDLPESIRLATDLGLVLGAGPLGRDIQRARPLDVALAVRDLLPIRTAAVAAASTGGAR